MAIAKGKMFKKTLSFKDFIKSRVKKSPPLSRVQAKLNKLHVSLTEMVLEERNNA